MPSFSNWFFNPDRIHEDSKTTDERLALLKKYGTTILKVAAAGWVTILLLLFSLIVTVRAAITLPLF